MLKDDPQPVRTGTLASLAPLLDDDPEPKLGRYSYYEVRLNAAGIGPRRIFRVKDYHVWPVVTEDIKTALEQEDATGVRSIS